MNIGDFNDIPESRVSSATVYHQFDIGAAIGAERTAEYPGPRGWGLRRMTRFYFGEYIAGLLFLFAVASFIFLAPETLVRPGRMIISMIDRILKKTLDFTGALLGLILCLPVFIIIPILIILDSPGPVFYTQDRVGINRRKRSRRSYRCDTGNDRRSRERRREDYHGRPFRVIKFRTMVNDAERNCGPVWATKNDPRITRLGRLLRKTRIDEIPQLLNVLRGDMSLVGPRPERPKFVSDFATRVPGYGIRLKVKPGITGLAQVTNGYDSSLQSVVDKVKKDGDYIRNWSIWSDVRILMRTVLVVLTGRGAC
ncbi:MAG: sugar transferase [Candidatus Zixiibacteriota bacterium]|nr:MAG: sugar transferase [candidate division Zixibacteria bacterium]